MNPSMNALLDFLRTTNTIDLIAAVFTLILVVRGAIKGISGEIGQLLALFFAFGFVWFTYTPLCDYAASVTWLPKALSGRGFWVFTLLLLAGILIFWGFQKLFTETIRLVVNQPLDAVLGAVFSLCKVLVLFTVAYVCGLLQGSDYLKRFFDKESVIGQFITPAVLHFTEYRDGVTEALQSEKVKSFWSRTKTNP